MGFGPYAAFYGIVALNALFASLVWCVAAPTRASITALVACAVAWPLVNGPLEGHVLWSIDEQHGITVSDLFSVAALTVAAVKFRQLRR